MTGELVCSKAECHKEILGVGVLLADTLGAGIDWSKGGYLVYGDMLDDEGGQSWIALHPTCFLDVFNELMRQELATAVTMFVGTTGDLKGALMPE